jgi:phosphoribosylformylglycinamidine cyclo-ligase
MAKEKQIPATYAGAGVDIDKGDKFVEIIKSIKSRAIPLSLGGFSGGMELDLKRYKNPLLLSTTDGVGTKILVALDLQQFDTIGIDLVAMCVNDLIVCGAEPLLFLDYIACGKIDLPLLKQVMQGIVRGCEQAHCTLAGGETAEMPDMYTGNHFDLAGFAVGLVEKNELLPKPEEMQDGDIILGLPSTGVHSNGFSLARKVLPRDDKSLLQKLLVPTKIYVDEMKILQKSGYILSAAHITGGGLYGNIERVIPKDFRLVLDNNWPVPEIFTLMQKYGSITEQEMYKVFNMGIGLAVIVKKENADKLLSYTARHKVNTLIIGRIKHG